MSVHVRENMLKVSKHLALSIKDSEQWHMISDLHNSSQHPSHWVYYVALQLPSCFATACVVLA